MFTSSSYLFAWESELYSRTNANPRRGPKNYKCREHRIAPYRVWLPSFGVGVGYRDKVNIGTMSKREGARKKI